MLFKNLVAMFVINPDQYLNIVEDMASILAT